MSKPSYSIPRVPPGLTEDAIADAIAVAYSTVPYGTVKVQLVPANPIFRYGGVQHAALITMPASDLEATDYGVRVVYDLEAQLHFTIQKLQKMNGATEKQRMWRWALRGIVIQ